MATDELFAKLQRRNRLIDAAEEGEDVTTEMEVPSAANFPSQQSEIEDDLASKLQRRNKIIDSDEQGLEPELPSLKVFNPYTEFKEFSRKQIQYYQKMFNK